MQIQFFRVTIKENIQDDRVIDATGVGEVVSMESTILRDPQTGAVITDEEGNPKLLSMMGVVFPLRSPHHPAMLWFRNEDLVFVGLPDEDDEEDEYEDEDEEEYSQEYEDETEQ